MEFLCDNSELKLYKDAIKAGNPILSEKEVDEKAKQLATGRVATQEAAERIGLNINFDLFGRDVVVDSSDEEDFQAMSMFMEHSD